MKAASTLFGITLALSATLATAQSASPAIRPPTTVRTLYLKNAIQPNDLNEILTTIRNMLPTTIRIYSMQPQSAIVIDATPDAISLAERLIADLDRPRKAYLLTYTITEFDGTRRLSTRHISLDVVAGNTATLKQGTRISVINTVSSPDSPTAKTQSSYADVGLSVTASIVSMAESASVRTKIEESSIAPEKSGAQNPDILQTSLEDVSVLTPGKPSLLSSLELPGTTHHLEIEAILQPLH